MTISHINHSFRLLKKGGWKNNVIKIEISTDFLIIRCSLFCSSKPTKKGLEIGQVEINLCNFDSSFAFLWDYKTSLKQLVHEDAKPREYTRLGDGDKKNLGLFLSDYSKSSVYIACCKGSFRTSLSHCFHN